MNSHSIFFLFLISNVLFLPKVIPQTFNVTSPADSGGGTLRQAITDINLGSDASNTINLQVPGNSPIMVNSDLPVIKKNTEIVSTGEQPINGGGQYRLFATIMADLSLTNCILQNGAAIGGTGAPTKGSGGGLGAGGAIYIDRGNTLTLTQTDLQNCKAIGGQAGGYQSGVNGGGGGASFTSGNKNASEIDAGGDFPGIKTGAASDGSTFLTGYGGGNGGGEKSGQGGGNAIGQNNSGKEGGSGGYCGGGGGGSEDEIDEKIGGGGGNGGGALYGGGFGSGGGAGGGAAGRGSGGGGFGGGGAGGQYLGGGGGFGAGGGGSGSSSVAAQGGHYGGKGASRSRGGGGGAGLGGAIFVGDTATCIIKDDVNISGNSVLGGRGSSGGNPGQGYAPDIFLFREAKVVFDNEQPLNAPYSIMADQEAPAGHLDKGIVKQGSGQLTLSNTNNNYRGGTSIDGGTLSVSDPKALGSNTAPITLDGGTLQPTKSMTLSQPIVANGTGGIDTPGNTTLTTTGNISGSGTIDKSGTGTWKQTGTSTHTGDLNVNEGTLQVDGTLPSNINIKNGATLQGRGRAGGNVTNSGTVKPSSDQLGTLTVGGNYTQNPDGLLQLQMKPGNQSDHFRVNGTADIKGTVDFDLEPGIYPKNQNYNLINAQGGLNFDPNQITSNSRFTAELQITPNNLNITFDNPQIILPIPTNQLPNNQKNLSNYLFCDEFPFENDNLINFLQVLFQLPVPQYIKILGAMTPEQYGALPITEKNNIQYLLSLKQQSCIEAYKYFIVTPLFYTDHYQKKSHLPNYVQNTGGVNITYQTHYPSKVALGIAASYLNTHIRWADKKGKAVCDAFYLAPSLLCRGNGIECKMTVLGSYNMYHVDRRIIFPTPIRAQANPTSWSVAESVSLTYNHKYRRKIFIIPSLTLLQTNVFNRKISENKPKGLNLQTEPKTHCYLDTTLSLGFKTQKRWPACCAVPSITFGWYNVRQLTDQNYTSKLDNYVACCPSFSTKTYSAQRDRFFIEGALSMAHVCNWGINHSARVEFGSGDLIVAARLSFDWAF